MNSKNTVRIISALLVILIVIVGALLWSRSTPGRSGDSVTFTSKFGYTVSIPAEYKAYEDANGMVAFPKLVYSTATTTSLDYHGTYGANTEGISINALLPDPGLTDILYDMMTQTHATSTWALPEGALVMHSNTITPSDSKSPEGAYRGTSYSFKTTRGVYVLNIFSTDEADEASRTALAKSILASFSER